MTEQPRDSKGRFALIDTEAVEQLNEDDTIGECVDDDVTSGVDYINVNVDYLQEAIEEAQMFSDMVRIGVISTEGERGDKNYEKGMVLVKGSPRSDRVVPVVGLTRVWSED